MNKMRFYLMLLLLFGLFIQPCVAETAQQSAEANVAKLSEAEMRAQLPHAKKMKEELTHALRTSNFSGDWKRRVDMKFYKQSLEYCTAYVAEIEKRLHIIDSKRESEQQQQGQQQQNPDEQRSAEFEQSVNENINRSQPRYREYNKTVDANNNAAREGSVALDLVSCNDTDPDFNPILENMLVQQHQRPTAKPNIRGKFNNKKSDESQTKEQQKQSQEDEYLKLMQEMQNDLNSLQ